MDNIDSSSLRIVYALLHSDAFPPTRKHADDAGMDVYAYRDVTIPPHSFGVVPTGISVRVPEGCMLDARPKSRSNFLLGAGVIDFGYQGEILIKVANITVEPITIRRGEAAAQLVASRIVVGGLVQVPLDELFPQASGRGGGGGIVQQKKD